MSRESIGSIKVEFKCPVCGPCKVVIAEDENKTISCAECNQVLGSKNEVDKEMAAKSREMARKAVLDAIKGR